MTCTAVKTMKMMNQPSRYGKMRGSNAPTLAPWPRSSRRAGSVSFAALNTAATSARPAAVYIGTTGPSFAREPPRAGPTIVPIPPDAATSAMPAERLAASVVSATYAVAAGVIADASVP